MNELILSERMPVLAMRGLVLFPQATMHFDVGREKSVRALEAAMNADQHIFLVTQKKIEQDDPGFGDLYEIGTVAHVLQVLKIPGDTVRVLVQGEYRARATQMLQTAPCMMARVESIPEEETPSITPRTEALLRQAIELFGEYAELSQRPMQDIMLHLLSEKDPGSAADMTAQAASYDYKEKMRVLSQLAPVCRLETANRLLARELEVLRLEAQLQEKTQQSIDKGQRDYYLREQLKVIRGELGENDEDAEIDEYREKIEKLHLPQEADEKLHKELQRLEKQPYGSAEASVIRNYLDVALELPWNTRTRERTDIRVARRILDEDHFGLEKVKERILEILAVRQLAPEQPGQIICLIGPPGVGKTSIAMSVARALNRKLARISLGGVHDEAEIRGHRKTYIGAMPGRILTAMQQAGTHNPLLLLDEIDKLGSDYRGDPSSALLEVLDAEQPAEVIPASANCRRSPLPFPISLASGRILLYDRKKWKIPGFLVHDPHFFRHDPHICSGGMPHDAPDAPVACRQYRFLPHPRSDVLPRAHAPLFVARYAARPYGRLPAVHHPDEVHALRRRRTDALRPRHLPAHAHRPVPRQVV